MLEQNKNKLHVIRSTKHHLSFSNAGRTDMLEKFISDYQEAIKYYTDYLWNNELTYPNSKQETVIFNVSKNLLQCPPYMDYNALSFKTSLSGRALSSAATQACGMVKSAVEKRRKQLWKLEELKKDNKNTKKLEEKIEKFPLVKPGMPNEFKLELSSKCALFEVSEKSTYFEGWIKLKSLGEQYGRIYLPIKWHKQANKFKNKLGFSMLGSFLLSKDYIDIRWEKYVEKKTKGIKVGCDSGITEMLATTDNQKISKHPHGWSYNKCLQVCARRKKGSKGFQRAEDNRENYINWEINQRNFSNISEFKLENNSWLHFKSNKGRFLYHHSYGLIKRSLQRACELNGVRFTEVPCAYRSQRCNSCGWVQKNNRKAKDFYCLKCGHYDDADHNSAKNQLVDLPRITEAFRGKKMNKDGFFWLITGIVLESGQEYRVPDALEEKILYNFP